MVSTKEIVMLTWILGIGIGAIFASLLLASNRTRDWSANRITTVSMLISALVLSILFITFYWRT